MNTTVKSYLIVDDDTVFLGIIKHQIRELVDAEIAVVGTGKDALSRVAEVPPDMVIIDVVMPDMDGIELLQALNELGYAGEVVLISGAAVDLLDIAEVIAEGLKLNITGSYRKPLRRDTISRIVGAVDAS